MEARYTSASIGDEVLPVPKICNEDRRDAAVGELLRGDRWTQRLPRRVVHVARPIGVEDRRAAERDHVGAAFTKREGIRGCPYLAGGDDRDVARQRLSPPRDRVVI